MINLTIGRRLIVLGHLNFLYRTNLLGFAIRKLMKNVTPRVSRIHRRLRNRYPSNQSFERRYRNILTRVTSDGRSLHRGLTRSTLNPFVLEPLQTESCSFNRAPIPHFMRKIVSQSSVHMNSNNRPTKIV